MPAGNDPTPHNELVDKFGAGSGRAEDLIQAARARYSKDLRDAQLKDVDENATALLDNEEVAEAAGVRESAVVSKAVRGDSVVAVIEGKDGRTEKVLLSRSDFDIGEEDDYAPAATFSSDAAEAYAKEKNLTPETIALHVGDGSGKNGSFTKKDVAEAAEKQAAA